MDEKQAYEIAGQILSGTCTKDVNVYKVQHIADRIVIKLLTTYEAGLIEGRQKGLTEAQARRQA